MFHLIHISTTTYESIFNNNYYQYWFSFFYEIILHINSWIFTILYIVYHTFLFKNAYKKTKRLTSLYQPLLLWWSARGSNPWPPACKADALPAELALQLWWPVRDSNPWMYAWKAYVLSHFTNRPYMAATVRIELTTNRLTAGCSTAELCGHISFFLYNNTIKTCKK